MTASAPPQDGPSYRGRLVSETVSRPKRPESRLSAVRTRRAVSSTVVTGIPCPWQVTGSLVQRPAPASWFETADDVGRPGEARLEFFPPTPIVRPSAYRLQISSTGGTPSYPSSGRGGGGETDSFDATVSHRLRDMPRRQTAECCIPSHRKQQQSPVDRG